MSTFIFANNVQTQLAAPITTAGQTTIVLASSANIPSIPAGDFWPITLNDALTGNIYEIMWATAGVGSTLTVLRGQEGTAATTWVVGDNAYSADTAATMNNLVQLSPTSAQAGTINLTSTGTFGGAVISPSHVLTAAALPGLTTVFIANDSAATNGMEFNVPTGSTNGFRFTVNGVPAVNIDRNGVLTFPANSGGSILPNTAAIVANASGGLILGTNSGQGILFSSGVGGANNIGTITGAGIFEFANAGGTNMPNSPSVTGGSAGSFLLNMTTGQSLQITTGAGGSGFAPVFGGLYTNSSDKKFKQNVQRISGALSTILKLKPSAFEWIETGKADLGFIAQEVQTVLPEIVHEAENGSLGIASSSLMAMFMAAFQEYVLAHP